MDNDIISDDVLNEYGVDVESNELECESENNENLEDSESSLESSVSSYSEIIDSINNGFTNLETSILSINPYSSLDSSDFVCNPTSFILTLILMFVALNFFIGGKK